MAHTPKMSLKDIWNRDHRTCWICSKAVIFREASRDHLVPVSLGGSDRQSNLRLAHLKCNNDRGNQISDLMQSEAMTAMQERTNRAKLAALLIAYRADVLHESAALIQSSLADDRALKLGAEAAAELLERVASTLLPAGAS